MRIGIDARPLTHAHAGIYRLLMNTLRELEQIDHEHEYFLYSRSNVELPFENPRWQKRIFVRDKSRPRTLSFQLGVSSFIAQDRLDLYWGAANILPLGIPSKVAKIVEVYDLVWHFYPKTMDFGNYVMHRIFADRSIRRADKVVTISESTRKDIEAQLGVPRDRISVIYPAAEAHFRPHEKSAAARAIAQKYGASESYICTVGTVEPRKNLITLMEAVKILCQRDHTQHQLLVAGGSGWRNSSIYETLNRLGLGERDIKFLGYVPEEDLPLLYSGASVFVFPSLYEGFGLPLVEAMACGVPIVASNTSSIPEVVKEAAILVSPKRPEAFAEAITRVLNQSELREALIAKGIQRARQFRYDDAARKLLGVFEEALQV